MAGRLSGGICCDCGEEDRVDGGLGEGEAADVLGMTSDITANSTIGELRG